MSLGTYVKNSQAKRAYPCNLHGLGANVVSNPTGASSPAGLTFASVTFDTAASQMIALISGGAVGVIYLVTIQFDLSNGEHPVYTFNIEIQDS
jgi:hypothetical protein